MLLEHNLPLTLQILKSFLRNTEIYPLLFYTFCDFFLGTEFLQHLQNVERQSGQPTQPTREIDKHIVSGMYTFTLISELLIKYIVIMSNKLPEKVD